MSKEEFISVDFKLPDHSNELSKAEEVIEKLKHRFEIVQAQHNINDANHLELFEELCQGPIVRRQTFPTQLSISKTNLRKCT